MLFELVRATGAPNNTSAVAALFACAGEEVINPAIFLFLHLLTLLVVILMGIELVYVRCRRATAPHSNNNPRRASADPDDFNLADALGKS